MKKSFLLTALAAMLIVLTGCDNTTGKTTYPGNLYGYWASKPDATNSWYALEVNRESEQQDTTQKNGQKRMSPIEPKSATLTHYTNGTLDDTDMMELTYYPSNGEGFLRGEGQHLPVQAKNDTVIVVSFAKEGDVEMYRGVKPEEPEDPENENNGSLEGLWNATSSDGNTSYLLIYPDKATDGVAHATSYSDEDGIPFGYGAVIKTFDTKTKSGTIIVSIDREEETMDFTTDYTTLVLNEEYTYSRQARAKDYAVDMAGTWKAGVQDGIVLTAVVQQDHSCKMTYEMPPQMAAYMEMPAMGTVYGHAYYSRYAGRGAFEMDSVDIAFSGTDDTETEMENVAGFSVVFQATSATSVQVPINAGGMSVALEFKKQ